MEINNLFAEVLIEELIRSGISYFCIAPGSRSTPLTYAIATNPLSTDFIHFDERSLGFHALGYSKIRRKPAPIIVTSGSAVANLLPAVVEAYHSKIPMLILSADRPFELRDCGANQTIDQNNIFGSFIKWQVDLPLLGDSVCIKFLCSTIAHALIKAKDGPVHLNCQFREPFFREYPSALKKRFDTWKTNKITHSVYQQAPKKNEKYPLIDSNKNGIIILSHETNPRNFVRIIKLSKKIGWPIFPDIISFARFGYSNSVIEYFEWILKSIEDLKIEAVLQFGNRYLSKILSQKLSTLDLSQYLIVTEYLERSLPNHEPSHYIESEYDTFCDFQLSHLNPKKTSWLSTFEKLNESIAVFMCKEFSFQSEFNEAFVIRNIILAAKENDAFYISSSMPIRYASFYACCDKKIKVYCNRGVSGIDGNISTAVGMAIAAQKPMTLIIGDLAFLYDLNALAQLENSPYPLKIIVLNNHGGGIFSFLPIASKKEILKRYFHTPHTYKFKSIADQFHLSYFNPKNFNELNECQDIDLNHSCIIEVNTDKERSYLWHEEMIKKAKEICYTIRNGELLTTPS